MPGKIKTKDLYNILWATWVPSCFETCYRHRWPDPGGWTCLCRIPLSLARVWVHKWQFISGPGQLRCQYHDPWSVPAFCRVMMCQHCDHHYQNTCPDLEGWLQWTIIRGGGANNLPTPSLQDTRVRGAFTRTSVLSIGKFLFHCHTWLRIECFTWALCFRVFPNW